MKKSPVKDLVDHLKNMYTLPVKKSQPELQDTEFLKQLMQKGHRSPWRANGVAHETFNLDRLPIGDLDNWQILRTNMSQRSYDYPKNYHGLKVPSVGREFTKYDSRDKDGKMPYLYESEIPKIEKLREKIYSKPFRRTNTVRNEIFGFPQKRKKYSENKLSPISLKTFQQTGKI